MSDQQLTGLHERLDALAALVTDMRIEQGRRGVTLDAIVAAQAEQGAALRALRDEATHARGVAWGVRAAWSAAVAAPGALALWWGWGP